MKIIFAQGNPGLEYAASRHNVGFVVLDALAQQLRAKWTDKSKFNAMTAEVTIADKKVILVKPTTFYNETGISARKLIDFYKLDQTKDLLVVHDDLALTFGMIRVRQQGSDAGNNGIKSLNSHLGEQFARIRIGTQNELHEQMDDTLFVLSKFNGDESARLKDEIIPKVIELIEQFCARKLIITSHKLDQK